MSESESGTSGSRTNQSDFAGSSESSNSWISLPNNGDGSQPVISPSVWNKISIATLNANKSRFRKVYRDDYSRFQRKFSEAYLYSVQDWLLELDDFMRNDSYWESIMDARGQAADDESDDEALLHAIDKRKYKIYKAINWEIVDSMMDEESSDESIMSVDDSESETEVMSVDGNESDKGTVSMEENESEESA
jgi:hypothetical protein